MAINYIRIFIFYSSLNVLVEGTFPNSYCAIDSDSEAPRIYGFVYGFMDKSINKINKFMDLCID